MQITLFGAVWIIVLSFAFIFSERWTLALTLFSMVLQCNNVIYIGETAIGVQIFTVCVACLRIIIQNPFTIEVGGVKNKISLSLFAFLLVILISMLLGETTDDFIVSFALIAVYVLFAFLLTVKSISIDEEWLEKTLTLIIEFVLVVGIIQLLCVYNFLPVRSLLETLIYNDTANSDVIFNYKTDYRAFYSTFMEPSYCGAFLVGSFGYLILKDEITKKNIFLISGVVLAILLTKSSTAYGGLFICIIVLLMLKNEKTIFKWLLPVFCIGAIVMFTVFGSVIEEVIFSKMTTSSFNVRSNWNEAALDAFRNHKIIGVGYTNIRASGLVYSILGELGIVGILVYINLIKMPVVTVFTERNACEQVSCAFFVVGVVICQIIACPDLNFSVFWLSLFVFFISVNIMQEKVEENNR